jgi:hypothetical protein
MTIATPRPAGLIATNRKSEKLLRDRRETGRRGLSSIPVQCRTLRMRPKRMKWLAFAIALVGFACGGVPNDQQSNVASGTRTPSPSPPPGYLAYTNPDLLYSFEYPAAWTIVPTPIPGTLLTNAPTRGAQDYQSNDIDFTIRVDQQPSRPCSIPPPPTAPTNPVVQASVDGTPASIYLAPNGVAGPWILHSGWCYVFTATTFDAADRDLHMPEIDHILSTFKFNR